MAEVERIEIPETPPVAGVTPGNYRIYHFDDGSSVRVFSRRSLDASLADAAADLVETFGDVLSSGSATIPADRSVGSSPDGSPSARPAKGSMLRRSAVGRGREVQLEDAPGAAEVQAIG